MTIDDTDIEIEEMKKGLDEIKKHRGIMNEERIRHKVLQEILNSNEDAMNILFRYFSQYDLLLDFVKRLEKSSCCNVCGSCASCDAKEVLTRIGEIE